MTMTPTAEVLTMTKKGLAEFLLELKRTQLRHQRPFETFVAVALKPSRRKPDRKTAGRLKKFRESPEYQQDRYARHIDDLVADWEKRQQAAVDKVRTAAPPSDPEAIADLVLWQSRESMAQLRERQFHSIRTYIGDLNRDVNDGRVAAYGTDMEKGNWWFSPDPVVVTNEGAIINGQHRLLAVERALADELKDADAPSFVVVWGVDKRAAILMDEARRTANDRRDIALRYAKSAST